MSEQRSREINAVSSCFKERHPAKGGTIPEAHWKLCAIAHLAEIQVLQTQAVISRIDGRVINSSLLGVTLCFRTSFFFSEKRNCGFYELLSLLKCTYFSLEGNRLIVKTDKHQLRRRFPPTSERKNSQTHSRPPTKAPVLQIIKDSNRNQA